MTTNTFIAGRGFCYWLDARSKLLLVLLFCILVFFPLYQAGLWILTAILFVTAWHATGLKQAVQPLRAILPMLIIMVVFIPFTYRDGEVILWAGKVPLATQQSLWHFNLLASRFIGITYLCTLYMWTTPMGDITLALRWYGLPYQGALVLTLSFRFVPFLAESFKMIRDSHALRNANIGEESEKRHPFLEILPTVVGALVCALKSIPHLAMTLEHRGFGRSNRRTSYRVLVAPKGLFTHFFISVMIPTVFWMIFHVR